jgi:hypothetical protein
MPQTPDRTGPFLLGVGIGGGLLYVTLKVGGALWIPLACWGAAVLGWFIGPVAAVGRPADITRTPSQPPPSSEATDAEEAAPDGYFTLGSVTPALRPRLLPNTSSWKATVPCPEDAGRIPQVAEVRVGLRVVRFFWCKFCCELFAFVGDADARGELTAGFAWHTASGGWLVFTERGAAENVELARSAVAVVGPQA